MSATTIPLDSAAPSPPVVTIDVDGRSIAARPGQSVAAALLAAGIRQLRQSPKARAPRGAFCFMGVCQECAIMIDGRLRQACMVRVREGLSVELRGAI